MATLARLLNGIAPDAVNCSGHGSLSDENRIDGLASCMEWDDFEGGENVDLSDKR
jgi:hypothetical protein